MPRGDLVRAMTDELPSLLDDLEDDTRNVVLTLARIWMTVETGEIRAKEIAADWALERLPPERHAVLARARAIYVGDELERWEDLQPIVRSHAAFIVEQLNTARAP